NQTRLNLRNSCRHHEPARKSCPRLERIGGPFPLRPTHILPLRVPCGCAKSEGTGPLRPCPNLQLKDVADLNGHSRLGLKAPVARSLLLNPRGPCARMDDTLIEGNAASAGLPAPKRTPPGQARLESAVSTRFPRARTATKTSTQERDFQAGILGSMSHVHGLQHGPAFDHAQHLFD